jgi:hypothetical protein
MYYQTVTNQRSGSKSFLSQRGGQIDDHENWIPSILSVERKPVNIYLFTFKNVKIFTFTICCIKKIYKNKIYKLL